ncbi:hypothetical protein WJX77_007848 [Trebouxia sp. C0004]
MQVIVRTTEGTRLCWIWRPTSEVLVQYCCAHNLSPDVCWLSLKEEQVSTTRFSRCLISADECFGQT